MLQKLLIYRTTRVAILFLIFTGVYFRSMAESKDLPKDLTNRITINVNRVSLKNALDLIAKEGKVSIIYSNSKELTSTIVSINVYDKMIKDVFYDLLNPLPFGYKVIDDKIVISFDPLKNRQLPTNQKKIPIDIKGRVTDQLGNSIPGATVRVKDANLITATDKDGAFELHNVQEGSVIIVSVVGYSPKEMVASNDLGIIVLEISTSKLDEVKINAGYYSVTDRERTGSISKVLAAAFSESPVNNPLLALEGRVPGLQITQQNGIPGGGVIVQIRGQNSISNGNDPLYIIDGVTYPSTKVSSSRAVSILGTAGASPLSFINPNDIESIEVLKDADATAIYGSRGANGVILISTKKGQAGNAKVNAAIAQGFGQVAHHLDMMNTQQYLQMRTEAFKNDGVTPAANQYDVNTWDQTKYTDWQKELIGGNAPITNASLNISGGSEKSNYFIGGNYYNEGTVFPGNFGSTNVGIHSNLNLGSAKDRLTASFTIGYSHCVTNLPRTDPTNLIQLPPNAPDPYDQYGKLNWSNNTVYLNPMAVLQEPNNGKTDNLNGNFTLNYRILDNLIFKTSVGYSSLKRDELSETLFTTVPPAFSPQTTDRTGYYTNNYNNTWIAEPEFIYNTKIGNGKFESLVGLSFQSNDTQLNTIKGTGYSSDDLIGNIASAATLTSFQTYFSQYRYTAAFARINYNLFGKYFLNLTARRDGSSRFGEGKQFANFGAVGAAWVFSDEKIIKESLSFLSFGKLRASYGITGNDQIADYGYLQLWKSGGTYQGVSTVTPTANRIGNPDFAWETNRKAEAALQLGFLQDKINLEISYYQNRSSNQLVGIPLPLSTGNSSIQANLPATVGNTGWEFEAGFKIIKNDNWQWTTNINLTIPRNKLLDYPGLATSTNASFYVVGQPLSIRRIYNVTGVNSQTGLYNIEDKNGNGVIDDSDLYLTKFIGQYYYGGLQNSVRFRQFKLDLLFAFTKQNGNNYMQTIANPPGRFNFNSPLSNQPTYVLSRWQQIGDQASIQKYSTLASSYTQFLNAENSGGLSISDASYIRLKNISLTYNLPKKWLTKLKVSNASISLQGQNIFTITNYMGLDPESQSLQVLPPLRTITMGLNVTF